jgi:hypothetical protein
MWQFVKWTSNLNANNNGCSIFCIYFLNQSLEFFASCQIIFLVIQKCSTRLYCHIVSLKIWIPCGAPNLNPIPNLFTNNLIYNMILVVINIYNYKMF